MALDGQGHGFVAHYASELGDLTFNSKPMINTLTMLASENLTVASSISAAIERHILTVFATVWHAAPEARPSLDKIYRLWDTVFPAPVLAAVGQQINPAQQAGPSQLHLPTVQYSQTVPAQPVQPVLQYMQPQYMQPQYAQPQFSQPQYVQNPVHYAQSQFEPPQNIQYAPQPAAAYSAPVAQPHMYTPASYVSQPPAVTQPPPIYSMPSPGYPLQPQGQLMDAQPTPPVTHLPQPSAAQLVAPATDPAARALRGLARLRANPAVLKEPNDEAVRRLLADSECNRSRHLDFRLRQQRRAKEAARKLSRRWFVDIDAWLSGATADDTTPAAFPGAFQLPKVKPRNAQEDDNKEEAAAVEQSVPADETQQICALSGERFETFWDDGLQQWRYRDAVLLDAEAATRLGLAEGTIVKASCLAPGANILLDAALSDEVPAGEVAAAAAEVTAMLEDAVPQPGDSAGSGPAGLNEVANGNALVPAEVKIEDVGAKRALVKQEEMEDTAKRPRLE